jgi:hypothetical protein
MSKRILFLFFLLLCVSCAYVIRNSTIEMPYRNKFLHDKKILILPFNNKSIFFGRPNDSVAFESLNETVHGMMVPALHSIFSGSAFALMNNAIPLAISDPDQISKLSALMGDGSAMLPISKSGKKYTANDARTAWADTTMILDPGRIKAIVPDAEMIIQVKKIALSTKLGRNSIVLQYVFYDADSARLIVKKGSVQCKFSLGSPFSSEASNGENWFKWFASLGTQVAFNSPFACDISRRVPFSYFYDFQGSRKGKKIMVTGGIQDFMNKYYGISEQTRNPAVSKETDYILKRSCETLRRMIEDSLNAYLADSLKATAEDPKEKQLAQSVELLKRSSLMSGLVVVSASPITNGAVQFTQFFSSMDPGLSFAMLSVLNAGDNPSPPKDMKQSPAPYFIPISIFIKPSSWNSATYDYLHNIYRHAYKQLKDLKVAGIAEEMVLRRAQQQDAAAAMASQMNMQQMQAQLEMQLLFQEQQIMTQMQQLQHMNQMQMQQTPQMNFPR